MPRLPSPRELGAKRFYARVQSFDMECPHCGSMAVVRMGNSTAPEQRQWSPRRAVFQCLKCERQYLIGLLAWSLPRGQNAHARPMDQIPGPRELDQMLGAGWWMPHKDTGQQETTNLTDEPDRPPDVDPIDLDLAISEPKDWTPPEDWTETHHRQRNAMLKKQRGEQP